jgi:hypothetical protein
LGQLEIKLEIGPSLVRLEGRLLLIGGGGGRSIGGSSIGGGSIGVGRRPAAGRVIRPASASWIGGVAPALCPCSSTISASTTSSSLAPAWGPPPASPLGELPALAAADSYSFLPSSCTPEASVSVVRRMPSMSPPERASLSNLRSPSTRSFSAPENDDAWSFSIFSVW